MKGYTSLAGLVVASLCSAVSPAAAQGWTRLTPPSTNIGPIACSADGSRFLVAGGYWWAPGDVLYVSHDRGATWAAARVPTGAWYAVASSAEGTTLMAAETLSGAVFISNDAGATWSRAGLPAAPWQGLASSASGAALYAAASRTTNGSPEGTYASFDGGATWSQTGTPPTTNGDWGPVACSADGTHVMAGEGRNVWISINSGARFRLAYTLFPPYLGSGDQLVCASLACSADGTKVAVGAKSLAQYGYPQVAVATSTNSGATWAWSSGTLPAEAPWPYAWQAVGVSAGGCRMAALGVGGPVPAGGLPLGPAMLSDDSGASWTEPPGVADVYGAAGTTNSVAPWTGLALSADGLRLTAVYLEGLDGRYAPSLLASQVAPAPVIQADVSGRRLVLSWIVPSAGFVLQQSPDLGAAKWTNAAATPVLNYSTLRCEVSVPAAAGQMFYRLAPSK